MMNNTFPRAGSSLYYSLLYCNSEQRQQLILLAKLWHQLNHVIYDCSDKGVATAKLQWWLDECQHFTQNPQHPDLIALQKSVPNLNFFQENLSLIAQQFLHSNQSIPFQTQHEFEKFSNHTYACYLKMQAAVLTTKDIHENFFSTLASALTRITMLCQLRMSLQKNYLMLPLELVQQHQLEIENLQQLPMSSNFQTLCRELWQTIKEDIGTAESLLTASQKRDLAPILIYTHLKQSRLQEYAKVDFPFLTQAIHLTPLRKCWRAWRYSRTLKVSAQPL